MNIYLDMDDVVADWHIAAQDFLKMRWNKDSERIPKEDWDRVKHQDSAGDLEYFELAT